MYTAFYNLKETPFNQSVDPKFTWLSEKQIGALAKFKQEYIAKKGFFLITGDAGTGKTAFVKRFLAEIESKTIVATVTDPDLGKLDFFNWLSLEYNFDVMFKSKGAFLTRFKRFLIEANQKKINVILIIDDAHRINQELVDEVLTLSNIEKSGEKLMSIFLVGQPGFNKIIQRKQNSALKQSINAHFHLTPLKEDEVVQLISHRLKVAGAKTEIFSSRAYDEIFLFSAGYPRMVINICDRAMIAGCVSATHIIDKDLIVECGKDLQIAGIKPKIKGKDANAGIPVVKLPKINAPKAKNQAIKKTHLANRNVKLAAVARSAMLPVFIAILVICALYFVYHFKTVLFSWASNPRDREELTSVQGESSVLNTAPNENNESEINRPQTANGDEPLIPAAKKKTAISGNETMLEEVQIDEKNISSVNQSEQTADAFSTQPTVTDRILDSGVDTGTLPIGSRPETIPPPASEQKVDEIISANKDTNVETLPPEIDRERELADREFKMLSRRLALRSKLSQLEQEAVDFQDVRLEPKIGRLIAAEPANNLQPRKDVELPQPVARKLYIPEKERQEADIQIIQVIPDSQKISDALPTDDFNSQNTAQLVQPVAKTPDSTEINPGEVDSSPSVQSESQAPEISSTLPAEDAKSRIEDVSQPSVPDRPRTQIPVLKSDLDPVNNPRQLPDTKVAAIEKVNEKNEPVIRQKLKERLLSFLEIYCHTYETKDLDHFTTFFAEDAKENNKPFHNLVPKYRRNFDAIEFINYRIEMQKFNYNDENGTIDIEGRFFLEWLPGGTQWKRNSGKIFMKLQDGGTSFKISELSYYGDQRKKSR